MRNKYLYYEVKVNIEKIIFRGWIKLEIKIITKKIIISLNIVRGYLINFIIKIYKKLIYKYIKIS